MCFDLIWLLANMAYAMDPNNSVIEEVVVYGELRIEDKEAS